MLHDNGLEMLGPDECVRLLRLESIGRVAVTMGGLPAVFPVNYQVADGKVVFRTGEGTKLHAALRNAVIAFEVDRLDRVYSEGWSVMVVGTASEVTDGDRLAQLGRKGPRPWAPGRRDRYIEVPLDFVSGRRIRHDMPDGA